MTNCWYCGEDCTGVEPIPDNAIYTMLVASSMPTCIRCQHDFMANTFLDPPPGAVHFRLRALGKGWRHWSVDGMRYGLIFHCTDSGTTPLEALEMELRLAYATSFKVETVTASGHYWFMVVVGEVPRGHP